MTNKLLLEAAASRSTNERWIFGPEPLQRERLRT